MRLRWEAHGEDHQKPPALRDHVTLPPAVPVLQRVPGLPRRLSGFSMTAVAETYPVAVRCSYPAVTCVWGPETWGGGGDGCGPPPPPGGAFICNLRRLPGRENDRLSQTHHNGFPSIDVIPECEFLELILGFFFLCNVAPDQLCQIWFFFFCLCFYHIE